MSLSVGQHPKIVLRGLASSRRTVLEITPMTPIRLNTSLLHKPRRIGSLVGLGMLAIAGTTLVLSPPDRLAALMASTSATAAEGASPPAIAMPSFANLVERLKPTVVSVYVDAEIGGAARSFGESRGEQSPSGENSPFEFF